MILQPLQLSLGDVHMPLVISWQPLILQFPSWRRTHALSNALTDTDFTTSVAIPWHRSHALTNPLAAIDFATSPVIPWQRTHWQLLILQLL